MWPRLFTSTISTSHRCFTSSKTMICRGDAMGGGGWCETPAGERFLADAFSDPPRGCAARSTPKRSTAAAHHSESYRGATLCTRSGGQPRQPRHEWVAPCRTTRRSRRAACEPRRPHPLTQKSLRHRWMGLSELFSMGTSVRKCSCALKPSAASPLPSCGQVGREGEGGRLFGCNLRGPTAG